ncbi:hypothetical protein CEXT_401111 [Caerostris extrusa]|uniref:Uncharacterized protein n=1 Tax=Caerostris extrusa TaxID=172846 RepID=A0AAV4QG65_CAEEX|nr:hypothetical protein CEXT_401111 [Caerostris extrusa]
MQPRYWLDYLRKDTMRFAWSTREKCDSFEKQHLPINDGHVDTEEVLSISADAQLLTYELNELSLSITTATANK